MINRLKTRNLIAGAAITALIAGGLMALPLGATAQAQTGYLQHGVHTGGAYQAQEVQYRRGWRGHRGYHRHRGYRHRHHRHHRHHRRGHGAAAAAGIIGLATGAIIGSALSQPRVYHHPHPPVRYGSPQPQPRGYTYGPRRHGGLHEFETDSLPLPPR